MRLPLYDSRYGVTHRGRAATVVGNPPVICHQPDVPSDTLARTRQGYAGDCRGGQSSSDKTSLCMRSELVCENRAGNPVCIVVPRLPTPSYLNIVAPGVSRALLALTLSLSPLATMTENLRRGGTRSSFSSIGTSLGRCVLDAAESSTPSLKMGQSRAVHYFSPCFFFYHLS